MSTLYDCDFDLLDEALKHTPSSQKHQDTNWILGVPSKHRNYWAISIYEVAQGGRKILRGEITASMTLAGLSLELDNRRIDSPIAAEAWQRLNHELSITLGSEPLGGNTDIAVATQVGITDHNAVPVDGVPERLSGAQFKQVSGALISAFSSSELRSLVRVHLEENLDTIASGDNLTALVNALIEWAQRKGKLSILLQGALEDNPTNPDIIRLSKQFGLGT